jgi:hypothetical protein
MCTQVLEEVGWGIGKGLEVPMKQWGDAVLYGPLSEFLFVQLSFKKKLSDPCFCC